MVYELVHRSLYSVYPLKRYPFFRSLAMEAIVFDSYKNIINPSRASPLLVRSVKTGQAEKKIDHARATLKVGNLQAICVSAVFLTSSTLLPESVNEDAKVKQRGVSGILHKQEWERFCGFLCMTFDSPELRGPLTDDAIFFSTKSMGAFSSVHVIEAGY